MSVLTTLNCASPHPQGVNWLGCLGESSARFLECTTASVGRWHTSALPTIEMIGAMSWESSAVYDEAVNAGGEQRVGGGTTSRGSASRPRKVERAGADLLLMCTTAFHRLATHGPTVPQHDPPRRRRPGPRPGLSRAGPGRAARRAACAGGLRATGSAGRRRPGPGRVRRWCECSQRLSFSGPRARPMTLNARLGRAQTVGAGAVYLTLAGDSRSARPRSCSSGSRGPARRSSRPRPGRRS